MSSKRYPEEFKIEAVKQVVERGHRVAEVASRLGVTTHSLYAWRKKYGPESVQYQAKSGDELDLMYTRLHKVGLGDLDNGGYWSSSDTVSNLTWFQFFNSGDQSYGSKNFALRVRAVRTF